MAPCPSTEVIYNYGISSYPKGVGVVTTLSLGDILTGIFEMPKPLHSQHRVEVEVIVWGYTLLMDEYPKVFFRF